MADYVFIATENASDAAPIGVFRSLNSAKLACEAAFGSGQWEQEDADAWTLLEYNGHQPTATISRWPVQD